jgi:hypothetical protein
MKPPLPVPERFCKNCKNKVEDEKPFILYCPLYKNLRNKYIINEESQSTSNFEIQWDRYIIIIIISLYWIKHNR